MHVKGLNIDQSPVHNACGGGHFVEEKGRRIFRAGPSACWPLCQNALRSQHY
jgi:hypothetical protein